MAAMAQEKSKTLHNFALPSRLNWGNQKLLRCAKLTHDHDHDHDHEHDHDHDDAVSVSAPDRKRRHTQTQKASFRPKPASIYRELGPGDDQIESIREKLIIDLRCEVDQMRAAILGNSHTTPPPPPPPPPPEPAPEPAPAPTTEQRPWKLRARKPVSKEPVGHSSKSGSEQTVVKKAPPPARGGGEGGRAKFSVALSRQEIEDDFVKMAGKKPPRKPKKRLRNVQRQMDTLFPGLWLSEVNADMYKVNDNPENGK